MYCTQLVNSLENPTHGHAMFAYTSFRASKKSSYLKPSLPYARRSSGICQSPPRVGKHYQNYDKDSHYHRYCDNSIQASPWRKDYSRRSQKEVERTNNDGAPVAPWFEHP